MFAGTKDNPDERKRPPSGAACDSGLRTGIIACAGSFGLRRHRLVHGVDQAAKQTVHVLFGRVDGHAQHVTAADLVEILN